MFSRILQASATSTDDTGTVRTTAWEYMALAISALERVNAADHLGNPAGREVDVARVLALGAVGQEEVLARPVRPEAARIGSMTSRVVPG